MNVTLLLLLKLCILFFDLMFVERKLPIVVLKEGFLTIKP